MVASHWVSSQFGHFRCVLTLAQDCLGPNQKKEVLFAILDKEGPPPAGQPKRRTIAIDESTTFVCARCSSHLNCFICHKEDIRSHESMPGPKVPQGDRLGDENKPDHMNVDEERERGTLQSPTHLLFRCWRCKQAAHYEHRVSPSSVCTAQLTHNAVKSPSYQESTTEHLASHYQRQSHKGGDAWSCHQCREWIWTIDMVCYVYDHVTLLNDDKDLRMETIPGGCDRRAS